MMSLRAAVDGGRGWAVVQAHLHPRQVAEAHEFRMFPHALLHTMTYRLTQLGVELAGDIREATVDRAQPVNDVFAEGDVCLVAVNDTKVLGCEWHFDGYESFVTVYRDRWLGALLPSGHPRLLVTK
jgi:hypothetical protein